MNTVKNFVESGHASNEIMVQTVGKDGKVVAIICYAGSCSFHFAMTPYQAHDMAKKLIDIANTVEACQELADKAKALAREVEAEKA